MRKQKKPVFLYHEDGWIFSNHNENTIHTVSQKRLLNFLKLAKEADEAWANGIQENARGFLDNPGACSNIFSYYVTMQNAAGTVLQYPFGYILSFPSKQHLFRGELELYEKSVPNLNRQIDHMLPEDQDMYRILARLREAAFSDFLWKFGIVPAWEATICDVNYPALAQHYGFQTSLLDVTNDVRTALFFATCKYEPKTDSYRPLRWRDILKKPGKTNYGMIYHVPDHSIDYNNGLGGLMIGQRIMSEIQKGPIDLQSGMLDDYAFQIGFQPMMRCRSQSAYVLPMRKAKPLQEDARFEKIRFRHTPSFSRKVFKMLNGGKDIWPYEGIGKAHDVIAEIQRQLEFTRSQFEYAYHVEKSASKYRDVDELIKAVTTYDYSGKQVLLAETPVVYNIDDKTIHEINETYRNTGLLDEIQGIVAQTPESQRHRDQRYREIYGE